MGVNKMEMKQVLNELWKMDQAEIKEVIAVIKGRRAQIQEQEAFKFSVGDKVQFKGRRGEMIKGEVIKRNRTTVSIKTEQGNWKVSAGLLTKLESE